jgi:hypothetical protein
MRSNRPGFEQPQSETGGAQFEHPAPELITTGAVAP